MGLGRLSSDRESVAFQACGVSLYRMLRPLLFLGIVVSDRSEARIQAALAQTGYRIVAVSPAMK